MESQPAKPSVEAGQEAELKTVYIPLNESLAAPPASSAAPNGSDPAELVQLQALELAANRAELGRQQREIEELQRALHLRDKLLEELRDELKTTQRERTAATAQLAEARAALDQLRKRSEQQAALIGQLEAQIAERFSMTVVATDSLRPRPATPAGFVDPDRPPRLQPLDDDSDPILLNRKVMTVGRTRENDICVPSPLVSRDHARILVGEDEVELIDVGSINGSFVNNAPVRRQTLRDGDVVRFADRRYRFCA
jgi:hypothetical protein